MEYDKDGYCMQCKTDTTLEESVLCFEKNSAFNSVATSSAGITAAVGVTAAVNAAVPGLSAPASSKIIEREC